MEDLEALEGRGFRDIPDPVRHAPTPPAEAAPPAQPSPTRRDRRLRIGAGMVVLLGWLGAMCTQFHARRDWATPAVLVPMGVWLLAAAASAALLFRPDARGLPRNVRVLQGIVASLTFGFFVLSLAPSIGAPEEAFTWGRATTCMLEASGIALVPLVVAAVLFRRALPSAAGWRGAAIGALFGLSGAMGIHAACPALGAAHVLASHGMTILAGAALGAALGALGGRI
jgi:hypothetical protein